MVPGVSSSITLTLSNNNHKRRWPLQKLPSNVATSNQLPQNLVSPIMPKFNIRLARSVLATAEYTVEADSPEHALEVFEQHQESGEFDQNQETWKTDNQWLDDANVTAVIADEGSGEDVTPPMSESNSEESGDILRDSLMDVAEWLSTGMVNGVGHDHASIKDAVNAALARANIASIRAAAEPRRVVIGVFGGIADVESAPGDVEVIIVDRD